MKNVKEPAPHEKAAQIEKEAVKALSVDEVEEALTKSTYGINEEWANSDEQKTINNLKDENRRLRDTSEQTNNCLRVRDQEVHDLREQVAELEKVLVKVRQENKDLTKTISKMKYAHDEEVRALEDDLAEAKILGKKANEYSHVLDDDSCAFERILNLTDTLKCQAEAIRGVVSLIENETEARV